MTGSTSESGFSMSAGLAAISTRLTDAAAIATGALACAQAGSEREAFRIVLDLAHHVVVVRAIGQARLRRAVQRGLRTVARRVVRLLKRLGRLDVARRAG